MPVPNPGLKVDSDNQKVKFLMISGRPKTVFFLLFRGVLGQLTINNPPGGSCVTALSRPALADQREPSHHGAASDDGNA